MVERNPPAGGLRSQLKIKYNTSSLNRPIHFGHYAEVAQLVERNLAKVEVAGSSLVFRSKIPSTRWNFLFRTGPMVMYRDQVFGVDLRYGSPGWWNW